MDQTRPSRLLWLFGGLALFTVLLPVAGLCLAYLEPPGLFGAPTLSFERVWPLLGRSLALSTSVSILSLVAGTTLAWAEVRTAYAGRRILSLLSTLALATPSYLIATILREQMAPAGGLGHLMGTTEAFTGFWPAVLVLTVACTPYVHLLTAAALRRCPPAEEEAARSLGAGQWRVLSTIIAPRLRSTWAFALALVGLYVISDFGAVAILDCEVLTWELYKARDGHEAVTLGFGLMFVVFPLLVGVRLLSRQTFDERSVTQRQVERRALKGGGLCVVLLLHVLVIGLGVALPIGSLTNWVWQGLYHHVQFAPVTGPAITTLVLAGFCTTVVVIVSGVVAYLAVQTRPKTAGLIENMVYLTSSLPGVLVAVGILKLIIGIKREAPWTGWVWFETLGLFLLVGYCMRFLSQGFAAMRPAFDRLDPTQLEAARALGAGQGRRLWTLILPALKPGTRAAYAVIFLSIAKELPITLTLIPLGYTTLAYRVFDGQQEGSLPDVGLAGLTLLIMALGLQLFLTRDRNTNDR